MQRTLLGWLVLEWLPKIALVRSGRVKGNVLKALQVVMMARIDSCAPSFFRLVLDRKKRIMESEKVVAFNSNPRGVVVRVKCWKVK